MTNLFWDTKTLVCDICKERPMKKTVKIKGEWTGVCEECEPKEEKK